MGDVLDRSQGEVAPLARGRLDHDVVHGNRMEPSDEHARAQTASDRDLSAGCFVLEEAGLEACWTDRATAPTVAHPFEDLQRERGLEPDVDVGEGGPQAEKVPGGVDDRADERPMSKLHRDDVAPVEQLERNLWQTTAAECVEGRESFVLLSFGA